MFCVVIIGYFSYALYSTLFQILSKLTFSLISSKWLGRKLAQFRKSDWHSAIGCTRENSFRFVFLPIHMTFPISTGVALCVMYSLRWVPQILLQSGLSPRITVFSPHSNFILSLLLMAELEVVRSSTVMQQLSNFITDMTDICWEFDIRHMFWQAVSKFGMQFSVSSPLLFVSGVSLLFRMQLFRA